jgi:hypothetical protein
MEVKTRKQLEAGLLLELKDAPSTVVILPIQVVREVGGTDQIPTKLDFSIPGPEGKGKRKVTARCICEGTTCKLTLCKYVRADLRAVPKPKKPVHA